MSRRTERVSHLLRNVIADALRTEISDPRVEPLTSITRVEISDDLSIARVYVSVMAPEARRKLTVQALQAAAGRIRSVVKEQVVLRTLPRLTFYLDESVKRSAEMVNTLDRLMDEANARNRAMEPAPDRSVPPMGEPSSDAAKDEIPLREDSNA